MSINPFRAEVPLCPHIPEPLLICAGDASEPTGQHFPPETKICTDELVYLKDFKTFTVVFLKKNFFITLNVYSLFLMSGDGVIRLYVTLNVSLPNLPLP